jgi:hypothetical protein
LKAPHLLRVEEDPEQFAPVVEAARAEGLRVGWLELAEVAPLPEVLECAAGLGVLRAVAVGNGRTVAVKPMRGAPVLKDVLREHFLGCALVLVRGEVEAARLRLKDDGWVVEVQDQTGRAYSTEKLVAELRSPHAFT